MRKVILIFSTIFIFTCGCATVPIKKNNSLQITENAYPNYKTASELMVQVDRKDYYSYVSILNAGWKTEDKNLEKLLSDNEPALKELKKGLEKGQCTIRVVTNPEERREILFYLDGFRELARLLTLKTQFHIYKKEYNQATQDCIDIIKFGQHLEKGGNSLSKRMGMAIESNGYKNLRNAAFQAKGLNYSHLLENIQSIKNNNFETMKHLKILLENELHDISFNVSPLLLGEKDWQQFKENYNASGYTQEDIMKSIGACYIEAMEYIDSPYNEGLKSWQLPEKPQNPVQYILMPILRNMYIECGRLDTERDATSIVIGLEYYNSKNNKYPEKLLDLVPKYLPSLPLDPFTGESFIYQRMGKGWKIYSLGSDLKNDFGEKNSYTSKDGTGDIIFYKE